MSEQKRNEQEKRFCMHCGSPIEGTERFCMKCGKELSPKPDQNVIQKSVVPTGKPARKGSFLKYIGIAVGVVLVIGIVASMSGSSETPKTDKTEVSAKTESSTETSRLSAYELYMQAQDNETMPYKISAKAVDFLKNHEELFPTKSEEDFTDSELVDNEVEAKHIYKNQEKYGDKFMILPELLVSQIWEIEIENGQYFSEINAVDALGQQYYIMYNGTLDNIFEEDVIYACVLPLGVSTFKNTEGGDTWTVVMAGSSVGKIQDTDETDSMVAQENSELSPGNLEQASAEIINTLTGTYVAHNQITGSTTTIVIPDEGPLSYQEISSEYDFKYDFDYGVLENELFINDPGMTVYYSDAFTIEPDGNLAYTDVAEEGAFTVWFIKQ